MVENKIDNFLLKGRRGDMDLQEKIKKLKMQEETREGRIEILKHCYNKMRHSREIKRKGNRNSHWKK